MRKVWVFLMLYSIQAAGVNKPFAKISFDLLHSYILVQTKINQTSPLSLIFDSGVRNTIITELQGNDSLELKYTELKTLQGLGEGVKVDTYVSTQNELQLDTFTLAHKLVYVLKENYFRFSEQYGTEVNGFLGNDICQNNVVEINYDNKELRYYRPQNFKTPRNWHKIPIKIKNGKLYVDIVAVFLNGKSDTLTVLLDTGAQLNAWFSPRIKQNLDSNQKFIYGRIGEGFGGEIKGNYFKTKQISIGKYVMKSPVVVCPDSLSVSEVLTNSERDGSIGSEILYRFNIIVNFSDSSLYLKPNQFFHKKFNYNVAGLEIIQSNLHIPRYEVVHVWKNSPAEKSGLLPGDEIISINGEPVIKLTLAQTRSYFEQNYRHKLYINYVRGVNNLTAVLQMSDLLK